MYNYVIYTDGFNELERMFFLDIEKLDNVQIISKNNCFNNRLFQKLFRIHFSFQINNRLNIPFKAIWFDKLKRNFDNDNTTIYLFMPSWYYPEFFEYLRRLDSKCKLAFYFGDTIASKKKNIKNLSINYLKHHFDYIGSYNPNDADAYKIDYLPMCYSKFPDESILPKYDSTDLLFIGAARNRIDLIKQAYTNAKKAGLKVFFYVVGNENDIQAENDLVVTCKPMSYREYLGHVLSTKCILEIVDSDSKGGTLRFWDAIMYNKQLITNNEAVLNSKYFDKINIQFTREYGDDVFKGITSLDKCTYDYSDENSPLKFIKRISDVIDRKN